MKPILIFALPALLLAASGLSAQDAPPRERLVPLVRDSDGAELSLDTATVSRLRPAVFSVRRVVQLAAPVTLPNGRSVDRELDVEELDCAQRRFRAVRSQLFSRDSLVDDRRLEGSWTPVPDERVPTFRTSCDVLRPFDRAAYDRSRVEAAPAVANPRQVAMEMSRAYPAALRDQGVTGSVTLRMRVMADGNIDQETVEILDTTQPEFSEAALRVARAMRFTPARVRGHAISAWVVLPVRFELAVGVPLTADPNTNPFNHPRPR